MTIEIQRCRPGQAEILTQLAHASKRYWGYPEKYIRAWRPSLTITPDLIDAHVVNAAIVEGEVAGFYVLIPRGERVELEHFWVAPQRIGQGLGRALLAHAVETASSGGARFLDITSDPNAEGFYKHLGARRVGEVYAPVDNTDRFLPRLALELGTCAKSGFRGHLR